MSVTMNGSTASLSVVWVNCSRVGRASAGFSPPCAGGHV
jgi:hypothetical protein